MHADIVHFRTWPRFHNRKLPVILQNRQRSLMLCHKNNTSESLRGYVSQLEFKYLISNCSMLQLWYFLFRKYTVSSYLM